PGAELTILWVGLGVSPVCRRLAAKRRNPDDAGLEHGGSDAPPVLCLSFVAAGDGAGKIDVFHSVTSRKLLISSGTPTHTLRAKRYITSKRSGSLSSRMKPGLPEPMT